MNEAWVGPKPGGSDTPAPELGNANGAPNGVQMAYGVHRPEGEEQAGGLNGFEQNAVRPPMVITQEQVGCTGLAWGKQR